MASTLLTVASKSIAGPSVGRRIDRLPPLLTNVSSPERWASLVAGMALTGYGLKRGGILTTLLGGFLIYRAATGHCPVSQALAVSTADSTADNSAVAADHGTRVDASIVVKKSVAEVYRFWRDFENLPRFMTHLIDVDTTTDGRSRWRAKGPLRLKVEWNAEIIEEKPNQLIAWKSLPGSDVDTAGSVHFQQLSEGTEVRVELKYDPPVGRLGTAVAKLFGEDPRRQLADDLQRFREVMEKLPSAV